MNHQKACANPGSGMFISGKSVLKTSELHLHSSCKDAHKYKCTYIHTYTHIHTYILHSSCKDAHEYKCTYIKYIHTYILYTSCKDAHKYNSIERPDRICNKGHSVSMGVYMCIQIHTHTTYIHTYYIYLIMKRAVF